MVFSGKCFIASVRETLHTYNLCASVWYERDGIVSTNNPEIKMKISAGDQ